MDKEKLIAELTKFKERLGGEVYSAYENQGSQYGRERFKACERALYKFLEANVPTYKPKLQTKLNSIGIIGFSSPIRQYIHDEYDPVVSFIDSLILDIQNEEVELVIEKTLGRETRKIKPSKPLLKAFIVHGHDEATKLKTARFLEKLGFEAVILHEQANGGKTIIEKLEHFTDVGFGIVLYTPDDEGSVRNKNNYQPRARQNVVFEHGLLIGKLGRERVFPLVMDHSVELPGDISGMVYLSDNGWEIQLAKEIRILGYDIDFNKVI
ncbi:nucleotide-binding protein [Acinetobacter sp. ANC 5659]|uniref:TIR domain-containing protein n=1 Tax=Acinetobacter higginsii TaxID=70347 RepID=UPI001F4A8352|nr:nucleotide-binding protein [Acinetobacter higginsii]MCH7317928.1 nucleotide-binding protein [Acinetobacter higginsii]